MKLWEGDVYLLNISDSQSNEINREFGVIVLQLLEEANTAAISRFQSFEQCVS